MPLYAFIKHAHVVKKALKAFVCSDFSTAVTHKRLRRACWFIHSFIQMPILQLRGPERVWGDCVSLSVVVLSTVTQPKPVYLVNYQRKQSNLSKKFTRASCHIHRHYDWTNAKHFYWQWSHTCCMT